MKKTLSLWLCFFCIYAAHAQPDLAKKCKDALNAVTNATRLKGLEKVYLQTDRADYRTGDTIWFKAYVFNAAFFSPAGKSRILHLELCDDTGHPVKQFLVYLYAGMGWGNIALPAKEVAPGNYYLRTYTRWMLNFDGHYMFVKPLSVLRADENDLLIKARFSSQKTDKGQQDSVNLQLTKGAPVPAGAASYQVSVADGDKLWYKKTLTLTGQNNLGFNFSTPLTADPNRFRIKVNTGSGDDQQTYTLPFVLQRPESTDLQFMPEGGSLTAGLASRIAFKAVNEDGTGADVTGKIYNSKGNVITEFKPAHLGIGSLNLLPIAGEHYYAVLNLPGGKYTKPYNLPMVKPSGINISVLNPFKSDSLEIQITSTRDVFEKGAFYYLLGQSRGIGCFATVLKIQSTGNKIMVAKSLFPAGVVRFTLMNKDLQVLNERIAYIRHNNALHVAINSNKESYLRRDSVAINLQVADENGEPVMGSFSVAVTDDAQDRSVDTRNHSLVNDMLLATEVKGSIENAAYYLPATEDEKVATQLDNLLLAQGWVNYNWDAVFNPTTNEKFTSESNYTISGKVTNAGGKPYAGVVIDMLSHKPLYTRDTTTNAAGEFMFPGVYPSDTASYFLQVKNKKLENVFAEIKMDDHTAPVFNTGGYTTIPWYVNLDTARRQKLNKLTELKTERLKVTGSNLLREVKIKDKKVVVGSKNLNGDGGSDFALTKKDLEKEGKVTLGDLLQKYIRGFHLGTPRHPDLYFIHFQYLHLIIDGTDLDFFAPQFGSIKAFREFIDEILNGLTGEDIKGIELMTSGQYSGKYGFRFLGPDIILADHAFIEVTTFSGKGPFFNKTYGTYLYKPVAFCPQKEFYSPKYAIKDPLVIPDFRPTLFWAPNITTGKDGCAGFTFYTSDSTGTYTLTIEGTDMKGGLVSVTKQITVK